VQTVCVVFKGLNVSNECYLKPHKMDYDSYLNLFSVTDKVTKNLMETVWWKRWKKRL